MCKDRCCDRFGGPRRVDLLTSAEVKGLLSAAVEHAGGNLVSWRLDHVDANPRYSTTATYSAAVDWPTGRRTELLGASARVGGRSGSDERAVIFGDGEREVAVWLYPNDPDLPGLPRAAVPNALAALLNEHRVLDHQVTGDHIALKVISYRPRRRAVLEAVITTNNGPRTFFVKVLRESAYAPTLQRHELLGELDFLPHWWQLRRLTSFWCCTSCRAGRCRKRSSTRRCPARPRA